VEQLDFLWFDRAKGEGNYETYGFEVYCSNYDNSVAGPCDGDCQHIRMGFTNFNAGWLPHFMVNKFTTVFPSLNSSGDTIICQDDYTGYDCNEYAESGGAVNCLNSLPDLTCSGSSWCTCGRYYIARSVYASQIYSGVYGEVIGEKTALMCLRMTTKKDMGYINRLGGEDLSRSVRDNEEAKETISKIKRGMGVVVPTMYFEELERIACSSIRIDKHEVLIRVSRETLDTVTLVIQYADVFDLQSMNSTDLTYQLPRSISKNGGRVQISVFSGPQFISNCVVDVKGADKCKGESWWNSSWDCLSTTVKAIYVMGFIAVGLFVLAILICLFSYVIAFVMAVISCLKPSNLRNVPFFKNMKSCFMMIGTYFCGTARALDSDSYDLPATVISSVAVGLIFLAIVVSIVIFMINSRRQKVMAKLIDDDIRTMEEGMGHLRQVDRTGSKRSGWLENLSDDGSSSLRKIMCNTCSGEEMRGKEDEDLDDEILVTKRKKSEKSNNGAFNNQVSGGEVCFLHRLKKCVLCYKCLQHGKYDCQPCSIKKMNNARKSGSMQMNSAYGMLMLSLFLLACSVGDVAAQCTVSKTITTDQRICTAYNSSYANCSINTQGIIQFDSILSSVCYVASNGDFQIEIELEVMFWVLHPVLEYYSSNITWGFQNGQDCDGGTGISQCSAFDVNNCDPTLSPSGFHFLYYPNSNCYCYSDWAQNDCIATYTKIFSSVYPIKGEEYAVLSASRAFPTYRLRVTKMDAQGSQDCTTYLSRENNFSSSKCGVTISKTEAEPLTFDKMYFVAYDYPNYTIDSLVYSLQTNELANARSCATGIVQANVQGFILGQNTVVDYYQGACSAVGPSSTSSSNPVIIWSCCSGEPLYKYFPVHNDVGQLQTYVDEDLSDRPFIVLTSQTLETNIQMFIQFNAQFNYSVGVKTVVPKSEMSSYDLQGCYDCNGGANFVGKFYSLGFDGIARVSCSGGCDVTNPVVSLTSSAEDFPINIHCGKSKINSKCSIYSGSNKDTFTINGVLSDPSPAVLGNVTTTVVPTPGPDDGEVDFSDLSVWDKIGFLFAIIILFLIVAMILLCACYCLFSMVTGMITKKMV